MYNLYSTRSREKTNAAAMADTATAFLHQENRLTLLGHTKPT
jgi:hypothetical protein